LREEARDLSRAINQVYNSIVLSCQKKCLTSFKEKVLTKDESTCLIRCADTQMFLDNFVYETDTAAQIAATEGKAKKASFYLTRRIEDLTSTSPD